MSTDTLRRWSDDGVVPCTRSPGGQRLYRVADLDRSAARIRSSRAGRAISGRQAVPAQLGAGWRHALVVEAATDLASSLDHDRLWLDTAERLCQVMDVPNCDIHAIEGDKLVCMARVVDGRQCPDQVGKRHPLYEWPTYEEAIRSRQPVIAADHDLETVSAQRRCFRAWSIKSIFVIPLILGDEVSGVVELSETRRRRRFEPDEVEAVQAISRIASLAIRNTRLYRRQQIQAQRLATLVSATRAISSPLGLDEVLHEVTLQAASALGVTDSAIYEWDKSTGTMVTRAACSRGRIVDEEVGLAWRVSDYPSDVLVLQHGVILNENILDEDLLPDSRESMERHGELRALTVPLVFHGEVLGQLVFADSDQPARFTDEEVDFARALGEQAAVAMHNASQYQALQEQAAGLRSLLKASRAIGSRLELGDVLQTIARQALDALGCRECVVFDYDETRETIRERVSLVEARDYEPWSEPMPVDAYPGIRELLAAGQVVVETVSDPDIDPAVLSDMVEWSEKTCLTLPLLFGDKPLGFMVLIETETERRFTEAELELARGLAEQAGLALNNARVYDDLRRLHVANLRTLSAALSAKDLYTQGHATRVTAYTLLLGRDLGWSTEYLQRVEEAAMLHDAGKLAVSDRVLLKPGPLYEEEWALMRQHPVTSAEMVRPLLDEEFVLAIKHHHERYDGTGYPDGLAGEAIPLLARAMCVVDSYDAMSLKRPYRPSVPYAECRRELERCSGSQFDPEMVRAFLRVLDRLNARKQLAVAAARDAAALIDPDEHERLREPGDEALPEYRRLVAALRSVLKRHPAVRFLTTQRRVGSRTMYVGDAEDGPAKSRLGDMAILDEELERAFMGESRDMNALFDDEYGVWIVGYAPVTDSGGRISAVVEAAIQADEAAEDIHRTDSSRTFTTMLNETLRRISKAEIEAITDGLTGLYNHRYFHERLAEEIYRSQGGDRQIALLFADLDHFKLFNDRLGHSAGDAALHGVARVIEQCTRKTDIIARYGGEEFVAALLETNLADAMEVAERIRERIIRTPLVPGGQGLTVSIGVATFPNDAGCKEELVDRADWAMYLAKRRGRNRVVAFTDTGLGLEDHALHPGAYGIAGLPRWDQYEPHGGFEDSGEVVTLARVLALTVDLPEGEAWWASEAVRLRDIGYLGVPNEILAKDTLTTEERLYVQQHPLTGERMLLHLGYPSAVAQAVGEHHELLDGSGFPRGLAGDQISILGRVVGTVTAYHDMISGRGHAPACSPEEALMEMAADDGRFDGRIVSALTEIVDDGVSAAAHVHRRPALP